jgi:protein KRI1
MGRAHGSSKQLQSAPLQSLAPATSSAPTRGTDGGKAAASGAQEIKKSLFDDDAGGGDDMFFDAKKSKDVKSGHRAVVKSGEHSEDVKLQVNQAFADKFAAVERLKDGMRLKSLEEKYGSGSSSGTPSSSSDDGSIDEEVDNTLIKTLEMIKRKDPAVYDKSFKAFPDDSLGFGKSPAVDDGADSTEAATGKLKKSKSDKQSVTLKDYFRAKLLAASEKGHADLDEIDRGDADDADAAAAAAAPASYHEEAAAAKKAFLSALDDDTGSAAPADDSWFVAKAKSAGQSQAETEEAKAFVAGLRGKKLAKGDRQFLDFIVSGEAVLNPQERWLRQYVLNPSHASLL